jgi:AcrR family transcriptional regulator
MPRPDVSDERIPQILNAAAAIFSAHGIDGASMAQIAVAAEVSKATIYHYFAGKDALVEALVRRLFEDDAPAIARLVAAGEPAALRLRRYIADLVTLLERHRSLYPIMTEFKALAGRSPAIRAVLRSYFTSYLTAFTQIIEQGQARGELRAQLDAQATAMALVALIEGCILLAYTLDQPLDAVLNVSVQGLLDSVQA